MPAEAHLLDPLLELIQVGDWDISEEDYFKILNYHQILKALHNEHQTNVHFERLQQAFESTPNESPERGVVIGFFKNFKTLFPEYDLHEHLPQLN